MKRFVCGFYVWDRVQCCKQLLLNQNTFHYAKVQVVWHLCLCTILWNPRKSSFQISSGGLLEQMKVWKKKASSPTSLRINTWIVFHSLYIESLFLLFFIAPVEKHFLNFSFSISYFSRCISGKLLPLSFCRSKITVGYNSDFLSHIFGWL